LCSTGCLADACCALEDLDGAVILLELLQPFSDRFLVGGFAGFSMGSVQRVVGQLLLTCGRFEEAEKSLGRAAVENARIGATPYRADALWSQSLAVEALGREPERARSLREEAERLARAVGQERLLVAMQSH
jgi:hypothetical protein